MKKRQTWKGAVAAAGLALITVLAPAGAQTEAPGKRGDSQKPVVDTYNKKPDPSGVNQKLDAVRYQQENDANREDGHPPHQSRRSAEIRKSLTPFATSKTTMLTTACLPSFR
jgi:hypothetical protein